MAASPNVSTARSWKKSKGEDLELPSGNVALVKRPGPTKILSSGLMPDSLSPLINEAIRNGKGLPPQKQKDLAEDPKSIIAMLDAMDRIMPMCVIEPKVLYHKRQRFDESGNPVMAEGKPVWDDIPEEERNDDEFIYTDEVDDDDKMFLFQFAVGGTRDLEQFRKEIGSGMGSVRDDEGDEAPAE